MPHSPEEWTRPTSTDARAVCERLEAIYDRLEAIERMQQRETHHIGQAIPETAAQPIPGAE